jgi:CDP-ribitol ribitolphosphotransferase
LVIRWLYRRYRSQLTGDSRRICFLSRQADELSLDFKLLIEALQPLLPDWQISYYCYHDSGSFSRRLKGTLAQLRLVASSRLCVVDGYCPAVSIPELNPQTAVVQIWHSLGAIKKFGWQSLDTPAGRSRQQAEGLCMHRNYSLIIASGEGPRRAYAEAFGYPLEKIEPLGLPRMDYLLSNFSDEQDAGTDTGIGTEANPNTITILYAPTFRKGDSQTLINDYLAQLQAELPATSYQLITSKHQQDSAGPVLSPRAIQNRELLCRADYVVTDYSALAFSAGLIGKKVLFFVPDIDQYRRSPGLNIDLEQLFPTICFRQAAALRAYIERDQAAAHPGTNPPAPAPASAASASASQPADSPYATSGFFAYCRNYLADPPYGATKRIVSRLLQPGIINMTTSAPDRPQTTAEAD